MVSNYSTIPLYKVYTPASIDSLDIISVLESGNYFSGENVRAFEKLVQHYIDNPYTLVVGNNNFASLIALKLCNLKCGDEVIVSPMACLATTQPILNFQAKVVWADIDPITGSLDPASVESKISNKTKAIIHYHWGGYPGYIDEINEIGRKYGIPIIDDATESFGSEYKNRKIGATGTNFTVFSFQTVRLPNSIEGGAISFSSESSYLKALKLRDYGIDRDTFRTATGEISHKSDIALAGYNAKMNELSGYIGCKVMHDVPELLEKQRQNSILWQKRLGTKEVGLSSNRSECLPNYWVFSYLADNPHATLQELGKSGFNASQMHIRNDIYSCFGTNSKFLKGVEEFSTRQLSVPAGWWLDEADFHKRLQ